MDVCDFELILCAYLAWRYFGGMINPFAFISSTRTLGGQSIYEAI